jgi:hypothetical protein
MTVQGEFLDLFEGDTAEIKFEDEDGKVRQKQVEVLSLISIEPRIIDNVPIRGKRLALVKTGEENKNQISWIEMPRDIGTYEQEIKYGTQKVEVNEEEIVPEVENRETETIGTVTTIEVTTSED